MYILPEREASVMSGTPSEEQSLLPELAQLTAMLSQHLAAPLPESYEERIRLLEAHLQAVTSVLEASMP